MDGDVFGPYSAKGMMELDLLPDIMVTTDSMNTWEPAQNFDFEALAKKELVERLKATPANEGVMHIQTLEQKKMELKTRLQNNGNLSQASQYVSAKSSSSASFPPSIEFKANFNEGLNSIGGKIILTPTQLIFKAHMINFGDLSDRVFQIQDISGYEKGMLSFLFINFKNGNRIKLTVWHKDRIIHELEARRAQLHS